MKKFLICFAITILMVAGCSQKKDTAKDTAIAKDIAIDIVNQLEEGGLFEGNKDERDCYENFFLKKIGISDFEGEVDLNRLSKKIGPAIEVWKKTESEDMLTSFDIFEPGEECGGQDSSWTSACPLSEKEMESLDFIMGPIFAAEFTCLS